MTTSLENPKKEMAAPLFSIVTISYNAGYDLRRTIESVNAQSYSNVEHVFIDGGSTDGSVELIRRLAQKEKSLTSERDKGIADAFNKGTLLARGEFLCYLNAGDVFSSPDVLERVAAEISAARHSSSAVYYGDFVSNLKGVRRIHSASAELSGFAWDNPLNHQSAFIPRILAVNNPYDQRLALGMDHDFWLRVSPHTTFKKLPFPVAVFEMGGRSSAEAWEVHNMVIHRMLWHINQGSRITAKDLLILSSRMLRFKARSAVRTILGKRISLGLRAAKSRWISRSRESLQPTT